MLKCCLALLYTIDKLSNFCVIDKLLIDWKAPLGGQCPGGPRGFPQSVKLLGIPWLGGHLATQFFLIWLSYGMLCVHTSSVSQSTIRLSVQKYWSMLAKLLTEFTLSEPAVVWSYYVSDTSSQVDCFHRSFLLFIVLTPPLYGRWVGNLTVFWTLCVGTSVFYEHTLVGNICQCCILPEFLLC